MNLGTAALQKQTVRRLMDKIPSSNINPCQNDRESSKDYSRFTSGIPGHPGLNHPKLLIIMRLSPASATVELTGIRFACDNFAVTESSVAVLTGFAQPYFPGEVIRQWCQPQNPIRC